MKHHLKCEDLTFYQKVEARGKKTLSICLDNLSRTEDLSLLYSTSLDNFYLRVVLEADELMIREVLELAAKALETCFLFATKRSSEASFRPIEGEEIHITKTSSFNPANSTSQTDLINAIYLAVVSQGVNPGSFADIGMDELIFATGYHANAYSSDYACFLQSVFKRDGEAGNWLVKAIKNTFPDRIKYGIPEYIEHNDVEQLKVWSALFGGDEQEFNETLESALEKHWEYWSQEKAPFAGGRIPKNSREGFFSLPLTAICKIAHENNVPILVESPYLPEYLIYR